MRRGEILKSKSERKARNKSGRTDERADGWSWERQQRRRGGWSDKLEDQHLFSFEPDWSGVASSREGSCSFACLLASFVQARSSRSRDNLDQSSKRTPQLPSDLISFESSSSFYYLVPRKINPTCSSKISFLSRRISARHISDLNEPTIERGRETFENQFFSLTDWLTEPKIARVFGWKNFLL